MIINTRILTTSETNPHKNLALEDALLHALPEGEALLFLWQNRHTVVIGAGQNAWRECNTSLLEQEGGTLARRSSGGGAVYHDLGNLNFSFLVPRADYDVARQLKVVCEAVRSFGIDAAPSGRNDLLAGGRKFSGNAFRLLKDAALHHGTLIVDVDMALLGRYLNVDPRKMAAKGVKSVPARVVNLRELGDVTIESMRAAMIDAFRAEYGDCAVESVDGVDVPGLSALLPKYESWAFNYGQSPAGEVNLSERFDWGGVELSLHVEGGVVAGAQVYTDAMDEGLGRRLEAALRGAVYSPAGLAEAARGVEDVGEWLAGVAL